MSTTGTVLRWGGYILGAVLAIALIAAGVLFYLVSRIDVRAEVERIVENATGRNLTITGDVGVSFYPVLGLRAENATLANARGGRAPALAAMDEIDVGIELKPLLHREIVVRQLVLKHPRIALEVDANGNPNWIFHQRPATAPPIPSPSSAPSAPAPAPAKPAARTTMQLQEIRTLDGDISYVDFRHNAGTLVNHADLATAVTSLDKPLRIQGSLTYNTKRLAVTLIAGQPRAVLAGTATPLQVDLYGDLLTLSFQGQGSLASNEFNGALRASGPNLRQLAAWTGAPLVGGVGFEGFAVSGQVAAHGGDTSFSDAGFSIDQVRGRGDFSLSSLRNKPFLSGRLQLFDVDLNPYLAGEMPTPPADAAAPPTTPQNFAGSGTSTSTAAVIAVAPATDRAIDVQRAASDHPIDFSPLRALNANLEITTAAVLFQHSRLDSAQISLTVNDGYLVSTVHRVALYGGSATGRFEVDTRTPVAHVVQDFSIQGVDAQRFLSDVANYPNIEGRAELDYKIDTSGANPRALIQNANGRLHLEVVRGVLHGADLGGVARSIRNALDGRLIVATAQTRFQGVSGTFALAHGVLATENLSFNTPDLAIPGGLGIVDLNARTLDARLSPRSPRGGIAVPFTVRGPFSNLAYKSDLLGRERAPLQARVRAVAAQSRQ